MRAHYEKVCKNLDYLYQIIANIDISFDKKVFDTQLEFPYAK